MRTVPALLLVATLAACNLDLGAAAGWRPADAVGGDLQVESGAAPAMARAVSTNPVRVVSYNVMKGADVDGLVQALSGDPELAAAGVLLLQEIEAHPAEDGSRARRLAAALGLGYVYVPARVEPDGGTHGLAILSAFPIVNVQVMALPDAGLRPRIAIAADLQIGGKVLHVVDLHLDTKLNVIDRIMQLRPAVLDAPARVLVGGDFNMNAYVWADEEVPLLPVDSVGDSDQAPIIDDYMAEQGFDTPTAGLGATEHMYGMAFRLDALYTRGLVATPGGVERDSAISDHWPLWIDVTLP